MYIYTYKANLYFFLNYVLCVSEVCLKWIYFNFKQSLVEQQQQLRRLGQWRRIREDVKK